MGDFFTIQLDIADKVHRLRCKRSQEVLARRAARSVNEKLLAYGNHFNDPNMQRTDLLSMVAFHSTFEKLQLDEEHDISPIFDKIDHLSQEIDQFLGSDI